MKIWDRFIEKSIADIRQTIGKDKAISALSGGVDSAVVTALAHRAVGDQLVAVFMDDGLMRENEAQEVQKEFKKLRIPVQIVNVQERFFAALKGQTDPEEKRKAFRDTFYRVLGECVRESKAKCMLQGTIAADIIETKGGVKTQHNVLEQIGIDPKKYGFKTVEPLKELFKNEVREVAAQLGFSEKMHQRIPFPGPGLATRVIGEVTPERVAILRKATKIVEDELVAIGTTAFQYFAVLLNDQATGVKDGKRLFGQIIVVRSVDSKNALTAEPTDVPWNTLRKIQTKINKDIPSVVKVLYDLTPKPPSTIEYI
jgi:GMP synthase (glutamine-hydrolysing)